ncbi:hypothetical protein H310_01659 [Aphanomyces invadans]|uniref:Uncharacterized protein n=1 Tax=Aphanomyces invadans TaxID=157072 RepID=A0A024UTG7_9STRA|nr:hypothetical protein H310_01659 [Aphanomyces invadans]ETW09260.1 hypothetical protein H310_01659 [Aphanomyces invadans]|eukprot:XP_008863065.1 hypothetical protein H310_01659 [Aphanomyces invadans]
MKSKPRAIIQPVRRKTAAETREMVPVTGLDSDTLHLAHQLLTFSRPPTPVQNSAKTTNASNNNVTSQLQLLTPPHKIVSPLKYKRLSMSPVPFPNSALSAVLINSCDNIAPEELLRQHRLRFKAVRKRWQKWHRERHKRLSRFDFKQPPSLPPTPSSMHRIIMEAEEEGTCRTA